MPYATRVAVLTVAFGAAVQYLFYRQALGLNAVAAVVLFLTIVRRSRLTALARLDAWIPLGAATFAAFLAIRTETAVVVFDAIVVAGLCLLATAAARGVPVTRGPLAEVFPETVRAVTGVTWRAATVLPTAVRPLTVLERRAARVWPYASGALLSVPFLLVFTALFRASDAVFDRAWADLLDFTHWWSWLTEAKERVIIGAVGAYAAAGALAPRARAMPARPRITTRSAVTSTFLWCLVGLFASFVFVQITYLFARGDTLAATSLSYSEYARRGFFELLFVAASVSAILFGADLAIDRPVLTYRAPALTLLALTWVIVASALYRMDLYQRAYGWSELRLYALAAIVAVAAALVILAWAISTRRTRYASQPIGMSALAVALVINAIGPAQFVVRVDLTREATPEAPRPDFWYLASLGPSALPELAAARERLRESERRCLGVVLLTRFRASISALDGWQSWNYDREQARAVLERLNETGFSSVDRRDPTVCR